MLCPDADEVKAIYQDKPVVTIVTTLLQNLGSTLIFNKNEHIKQFFGLY